MNGFAFPRSAAGRTLLSLTVISPAIIAALQLAFLAAHNICSFAGRLANGEIAPKSSAYFPNASPTAFISQDISAFISELIKTAVAGTEIYLNSALTLAFFGFFAYLFYRFTSKNGTLKYERIAQLAAVAMFAVPWCGIFYNAAVAGEYIGTHAAERLLEFAETLVCLGFCLYAVKRTFSPPQTEVRLDGDMTARHFLEYNAVFLWRKLKSTRGTNILCAILALEFLSITASFYPKACGDTAYSLSYFVWVILAVFVFWIRIKRTRKTQKKSPSSES